MKDAIWIPEKLTITFDPEGNRKLPLVVKGAHYYQDNWIHVFVPNNFRCDGTSYPRSIAYVLLLLWVVAHWYAQWMPWIALVALVGIILMEPYGGRELRASIFHDAAYRNHQNKFRADAMYRLLTEADGVPRWRVYLNFWAVRLFGWIPWLLEKKDMRLP